MITKTVSLGAWVVATLLLIQEAQAVEPLSTPELDRKETYSERAMRTRLNRNIRRFGSTV